MSSELRQRRLWPGAVLILLGGIVALALQASRNAPRGPVEPDWDRSVCTRCRMLISDPRFASQLRTPEGDRLHFDDPGCLLTWVGEPRPDLHEMWFHDHRSDSWIARADVVFVPVEAAETPMGYGLGASRRGSKPGLGFEAAIAATLATDEQRRDSATRGRR